MGIANLNKGSVFDINTEGFPYKSLNDLELDKEYIVKGVYVLKKRGKMRNDSPNAIISDAIVSLPAHILDDVKAILATPEYIEQVKADKCAFRVYTYTDDNGEHRSIKWIDLD